MPTAFRGSHADLVRKRLELLNEIAPSASLVGGLCDTYRRAVRHVRDRGRGLHGPGRARVMERRVADAHDSAQTPAPCNATGDDVRLTIGMPLYNNGHTIERALDSLVRQSLRSFCLMISDDGSTDRTIQICTEYARRDSRITLVRQPRNLNYGNF